jgi:hypothetical protein
VIRPRRRWRRPLLQRIGRAEEATRESAGRVWTDGSADAAKQELAEAEEPQAAVGGA